MELHRSFRSDQQPVLQTNSGDFYVVTARPYEMPPPGRSRVPPDLNAAYIQQQQQQQQQPASYVQPQINYVRNVSSRRPADNVQYYPPTAAAPGYVSQSYHSHSQMTSSDYDDASAIPQSRTFRVLQSVMHDNDSVTGANGLPPPRSATLESMKRDPNKQRVRVLMPAQYNSPMGMYSAHNVLETFTAQAESMLEARQRPNAQTSSPDHEVYFIQQPQQQSSAVNTHRQVRYNTNDYSQSGNSSSH